MKYTAVIEIDDDRWQKHPYGIRIRDEDGNQVEYENFLNSWDACYRVSDKYNIPRDEIKEVFY